MAPFNLPAAQSKRSNVTPPNLAPDRGFTLIELMVTIAIMAILISLAAPSFTTMIANQRVKGAAADLHIALTKARGEALKLNAEVTLAPKTAGRWEDGWTLTFVHATNGLTTIEDHSSITGITVSGPTNAIYQGSGRVKGTAAPSFDIVAGTGNINRCVLVNLSGLPYLKKTAC